MRGIFLSRRRVRKCLRNACVVVEPRRRNRCCPGWPLPRPNWPIPKNPARMTTLLSTTTSRKHTLISGTWFLHSVSKPVLIATSYRKIVRFILKRRYLHNKCTAMTCTLFEIGDEASSFLHKIPHRKRDFPVDIASAKEKNWRLPESISCVFSQWWIKFYYRKKSRRTLPYLEMCDRLWEDDGYWRFHADRADTVAVEASERERVLWNSRGSFRDSLKYTLSK